MYTFLMFYLVTLPSILLFFLLTVTRTLRLIDEPPDERLNSGLSVYKNSFLAPFKTPIDKIFDSLYIIILFFLDSIKYRLSFNKHNKIN